MSDSILPLCPLSIRRASAQKLLSVSLRPRSVHPVARNALLLLCLLLLLTACGRRPGQPTPLPPGTRVAQNTPDFRASPPAVTATWTTEQVAESLRTRLAQHRTQITPNTTPAAAVAANPIPTPSAPYPSLAVFSRPTALGILSGGGQLYSAPGAGVVANLQIGATLTITGRSADGGWLAAYLADGTAGWVPAAQVRLFGNVAELETVQESLGPAVVATLIAEASKPQDPIATVVVRPTASPKTAPQPPVAAPDMTAPAVTVTVIVDGANLRAGPGTGFPVVGVLYQNEKAALLDRNPNGDWLQVQWPDGVGWIFAALVEVGIPVAELPVVEPPPAAEP